MRSQFICIIYCLGMMIELIKVEDETTIESVNSTVTETTTEISHPPSECTTTKLPSEKYYADCVAKNLDKVPDTLDRSEIEILNMSSNKLKELPEDCFHDYVNLRELIMTQVEALNVSEEFLTPLIQLEILDISDSSIRLNMVKLPTFIQQFRANHLMRQIEGTVLDLSNLSSLWELSVASNNLKEFPNLNKECPILFINLSGNPLENFKYQDLAPFCTLETLVLNDTQVSSGEGCCSLNAWMKQFMITSSLTCRKTCSEDVVLDEDKKEIYHQCEIRLGRGDSGKTINFVIEGIVVLSLILATSYLVHKYYSAPAVLFEKQPPLEEDEADEEQSHHEV